MLNLFQQLSTQSQNLVPNNNFSIITSCPNGPNQIYLAPPWFQPSISSGNTTNSSSSDLYDTCFHQIGGFGVPANDAGYQLARNGGGAYAGIDTYGDSLNYREYIEVPLLSSLIANNIYCVNFYVSLANNATRAISNMGAYFSVDSLLDSTGLVTIDYVTPQIENPVTNMLSDTLNWMLIFGSFTASGGERFMTIGNFYLPANTNFQAVVPSQNVGFFSYYYIDDVSVEDCTAEGIKEATQTNEITIYPNPFTSQTTITFSEVQKNAVIKVVNVLGECIQQLTTSNQQLILDMSGQAKGIYFVEIMDEKGNDVNRKIVVE